MYTGITSWHISTNCCQCHFKKLSSSQQTKGIRETKLSSSSSISLAFSLSLSLLWTLPINEFNSLNIWKKKKESYLNKRFTTNKIIQKESNKWEQKKKEHADDSNIILGIWIYRSRIKVTSLTFAKISLSSNDKKIVATFMISYIE